MNILPEAPLKSQCKWPRTSGLNYAAAKVGVERLGTVSSLPCVYEVTIGAVSESDWGWPPSSWHYVCCMSDRPIAAVNLSPANAD